MFVAGLAGLAAVGWLMELRMGRPIGQVEAVGTAGRADAPGEAAPAGATTLTTLAHGTSVALRTARRALAQNDRAAATHALDAALRAAEVGSHATAREASPFDDALQITRTARRALQNGDRAAAVAALDSAGPSLDAFAGAARRPAGDLARYEGGDVIDPSGVRLGEVESFTTRDGRTAANLRLGGWPDFMGLFDIGGRSVSVPLDQLVFGPARTVGPTLVALVP